MKDIKKQISRLEGKIKEEQKIIEGAQNLIILLEARIQNLYDIMHKDLDGTTAKVEPFKPMLGFTVTEE